MAEEMKRTADFPMLEYNIIREQLKKRKGNERSAEIFDEWILHQ
jgi:hypothetical protein